MGSEWGFINYHYCPNYPTPSHDPHPPIWGDPLGTGDVLVTNPHHAADAQAHAQAQAQAQDIVDSASGRAGVAVHTQQKLVTAIVL